MEITVHSYGGTRFLAPPQCICYYLSFAILPQPVPTPYFSGVFSGKTRRMHIQCQKYLSGMAYSIFKELCKVLFSLPLTLIGIRRPFLEYTFQNLFLCNPIFFIEIGCKTAFQRTAACKFHLNRVFTAPFYIRRSTCLLLCLLHTLVHQTILSHSKPSRRSIHNVFQSQIYGESAQEPG